MFITLKIVLKFSGHNSLNPGMIQNKQVILLGRLRKHILKISTAIIAMLP